MKIVLIAYYLPPANSTASYRVYSFAQHLQKQGHHITIIAPDWNKNESNFTSDLTVHFTHKPNDAIYEDTGKGFKNWVRREVLYRVFAYNQFRDKKPGKFYEGGAKLLENLDFSSYDFVISSYGPLDSLWLGRAIKNKYPKIKWIIDYRDYYSLYYKEFGIFKPYFRAWERKFVQSADGFITVSDTLKTNISALIKKPGELIYNGFLNFELRPDPDFETLINSKKPYISYTGALFQGDRNISQFLAFYKEHLSHHFDLIFALNNQVDKQFVEREILKMDVQDVTIFNGLTHNQSLLLTKNAKFPIIFNDFDPRSNGFLTGKIYEYIFFKKPVIYSGPIKDNELFSLFEKYKWGNHYASFDYETTETIDEENIQFFSRQNQAAILENVLLRLLEKSNN